MSSRTIDLDILLFGQEIINEPNLGCAASSYASAVVCFECVLMELNPHLVHPVLKRTVGELAVTA